MGRAGSVPIPRASRRPNVPQMYQLRSLAERAVAGLRTACSMPARVGSGTRTGPHAGRTPDNAPGKPRAGRCRTDTAVSRPGQTLAPPMSGYPSPWHPVCGHHIRAAHPGNAESLKAPHRQGDARSRAPPAGRPGHGRPRPTRRQIRRLGPEPRHKALKVNQRGRIPADIVAPPLARRRSGSGPAQRTPRSLSGHPRRPG
jgi:hypothetical protein